MLSRSDLESVISLTVHKSIYRRGFLRLEIDLDKGVLRGILRNWNRRKEQMRAEALQKKVEETVLDSYEAMYRLAYTYVRSEEDALDIVQESVYKAIKYSASVKQEGYIKTWLWRIVMNTALDFIRKNQKEIAVDAFFEDGKEDSYRDFDTIEALKVLTEKEKAVVVLRFFEDQKLSEIAGILNENTNTIKTILYRSLRKLKLELTEGELSYEG